MFFNLILFIYTLIYLPYLLLTGRWYKGFGCRLGFFSSELKSRLGANSTLWLHAVSVGEVIAINSLIENLKVQYPQYNIVLTVTTKTGYELAKSQLGQNVVVIPSPLDFTWVVTSFVKLIKPRVYIAAETEIWPNLFNYLNQQNIPIIIINGRISDTSWGRYKMIKPLLQETLKKVSLFCMQSEINAQRIKELGALENKVVVVGNIKFDALSFSQNISAEVQSETRPLWIAGSTHPGEEEIILRVFSKYKDSWSLVIAPRHVERTEQIVSMIEEMKLKAVRFSHISSLMLNSDAVIVVDTIGHLRDLYAKASLVFVGKSLCVGGGHNIIEPAVYAKPIIVGPFMQNFRDITALFLSQEALIQVKNVQEFENQVDRLIQDEVFRKQLGQKALAVVRVNQGAGSRTIKMIEKWL